MPSHVPSFHIFLCTFHKYPQPSPSLTPALPSSRPLKHSLQYDCTDFVPLVDVRDSGAFLASPTTLATVTPQHSICPFLMLRTLYLVAVSPLLLLRA